MAVPAVHVELGEMDILQVDRILAALVKKRLNDDIPDVVLTFSYRPCLSLGSRPLDINDLLKPLAEFRNDGIELFQISRGGGLTYHWPGQLVCYPILKLAEHEQNIPQIMQKLEDVGLRTLADLGVHADRKRDKTAQIGLWVDSQKVASMGIRLHRWVTSYGFALNLYGDSSPANDIRPCGLENITLATVEKLTGHTPHRIAVRERMLDYFAEIFGRTFLEEPFPGVDVDAIVNSV